MKIVLFTGGARSGKSTRAEQYAAGLSQRVAYIATAEAGDDEMHARIAQHQRRRPTSWRTLERPLSVATALAELERGAVVLLDCVSLLASNLLLAHENDPAPAVEREIAAILTAARDRDLTLIVVTNEVGLGIVPSYPLGRVYRDVLGHANQQIAAAAAEVYLVICGIPVELKALEAAWARGAWT
jgi:adenosylcobinamide kinase / adenosylcobinamide-phosphate guanylyltransferase